MYKTVFLPGVRSQQRSCTAFMEHGRVATTSSFPSVRLRLARRAVYVSEGIASALQCYIIG